jgi:hypothetical protein
MSDKHVTQKEKMASNEGKAPDGKAPAKAKLAKPSKRELAEGVAAEDKAMPTSSLAGALKEGYGAAGARV